jgi:thiol-disulfide isomerase/thioredoxin
MQINPLQAIAVLAFCAFFCFSAVAAPSRAPLPDVDFLNADNQSVKLSSFRGRVVLLNIYATWCGFCMAEMPSLDKLSEKYEGAGLAVIPVGIDKEGVPLLKQIFRKKGFDLPIYADPWQNLPQSYGLNGVPYAVLIDREGYEITRINGAVNWTAPQVDALVQALLKN